jgi:putative flippase GtrA
VARAQSAQFFRFVLVGIVATVSSYTVLIILVELGRFNEIFSSGLGYLAGGLINYWLNYHFTFSSKQSHAVAGRRFFVVMLIGLALNVLLMHIGMGFLNLHYLVAQLLAIIFVLAWSYTANRIWAFS